MSKLYEEIEPIKALVLKGALGENEDMECEIIAINSYPGEAITFSIIVDGSLYDYISPCDLRVETVKEGSDVVLSLKDLVYNNNPSENFIVYKSKYFAEHNVHCYFKEANKWMIAEYILSIDWYLDNDKRHLVILPNEQLAFVPNHKIKLNGDTSFNPDFKKLRGTLRV